MHIDIYLRPQPETGWLKARVRRREDDFEFGEENWMSCQWQGGAKKGEDAGISSLSFNEQRRLWDCEGPQTVGWE
jgi:hypothetical protein